MPGEFPPDVLAEAEEAASLGARRSCTPSSTGCDRVDRTDVEFVTLDPASSTDLDQAFAIEIDGDDVVLSYAIADVATLRVVPAVASTPRRGDGA